MELVPVPLSHEQPGASGTEKESESQERASARERVLHTGRRCKETATRHSTIPPTRHHAHTTSLSRSTIGRIHLSGLKIELTVGYGGAAPAAPAAPAPKPLAVASTTDSATAPAAVRGAHAVAPAPPPHISKAARLVASPTPAAVRPWPSALAAWATLALRTLLGGGGERSGGRWRALLPGCARCDEGRGRFAPVVGGPSPSAVPLDRASLARRSLGRTFLLVSSSTPDSTAEGVSWTKGTKKQQESERHGNGENWTRTLHVIKHLKNAYA